MDTKQVLKRYLQVGREALLWKLDGLSHYDTRRPMVSTGTNLLGLVKHTASVEAGYLGAVFDRPFPDDPFPRFAEDAAPNADMWATEDERQDDITALYRRVWEHSDATVEALDLDARGRVPWWGEHGDVTLHTILLHVATETHRHAGHADIVRELIDGAVGLRMESTNVPDLDRQAWADHHARVEAAARATDK
jgi:uncharacterized damage-inducible protein DinB